VNSELFHLQNKEKCRKHLGFPQNDFIVAFLGWFNERKGVQRVSEAINRVGGIKCIFIGNGELEPQCDGILYKGALPHHLVPQYLGAADCFVLPTLAEGCCNAIVEAMACGLPVVSSNLPFNWDVLDETNSIMVNPNDIEEISKALVCLKNDAYLRANLSKGAVNKADSLTIEKRAERILTFMKSKIGSMN
jgi:glycosyltransferase involved in cell wall biosynthesis